MKHSSKRPGRHARAADIEPSAFLKILGERVRTLRNRRGVSRKVLARQSDISERYLIQLEAGVANCSIILLQRIAKAIGLQLSELVDARSDRQIETILLEQFLGRLSPAQVPEARALLIRHFEGKTGGQRGERIAFVGLRGAGKSTIGQLLSAHLAVPFLELDRIIEKQKGMSLGEMLEMFGQETFRRGERSALETALSDYPSFVMATGGGIVAESATYELLLTSCLTVWVRAAPEEHMRRVMQQGDLRPMANNTHAMDDLISILRSREPLYARADIVLDTAGKTPKESLRELVALLDVSNFNLARRTIARQPRST